MLFSLLFFLRVDDESDRVDACRNPFPCLVVCFACCFGCLVNYDTAMEGNRNWNSPVMRPKNPFCERFNVRYRSPRFQIPGAWQKFADVVDSLYKSKLEDSRF